MQDWTRRCICEFTCWGRHDYLVHTPKVLLNVNAALDFANFLCRLKIFVPIALLAWAILVPVNWTNNTLAMLSKSDNLQFSDVDKLSISNIPHGSKRFGASSSHN